MIRIYVEENTIWIHEFNNRWTIRSSYDFLPHLQHSQRRCFSQTALLWFEVLPDLSPALRGLSSALPYLSSTLPDLSSALPDLSPALPGAPRCTQSSLRRSEVFTNISQSLPWYSCTSHQGCQLLRRPARMPSYGLILTWNWRIYVYTPHPLRHIWSLPETKIHCAEVFSWHRPGDNESIVPILTSIIDATIVSTVNTAIPGLPYPSWKIWELWGYREEPNGDGGPHSHDVTTIFDNNTPARWVEVALNLHHATRFCIVYRGQWTDSTSDAQSPMHGGRSYLPLDDNFAHPAEDMIDDIREKSDDDAEVLRPNPKFIPTTKTDFQKIEWKLQRWIIRQQQYLEVNPNCALGHIPNHEQNHIADEDVTWLHEHCHNVHPPAAGSLANRKHPSSRPAAN